MFLLDCETYVPDNRPLVHQCYRETGISEIQAKIFERIFKIQQIPMSEELNLTDFLSIPLEKLIHRSPDIIDRAKYVIYAHTSDSTTIFGNSAIRELQQQFGFNQAIAFGTNLNKCVAYIKALELAKVALKGAQDDAVALIIVGEICTSPSVRLIPNTSIGSDAVAIAVVSLRAGQHALLDCQTQVDGTYAKGIWLTDQELAQYDGQYVEKVSHFINQGLKRNQLSLSDIELIIPHNVNVPSWQKVVKQLGISMGQVFIENVPKIAHSMGADNLINLQTALQFGRLKKGMKSMMVSVGLGASYGYAIWQH